jgi:hypothetical protein
LGAKERKEEGQEASSWREHGKSDLGLKKRKRAGKLWRNEHRRTPTHQHGGCTADMDLAEAEHAAIAARPRSSFTSVALAGMGKPRDLVTEWEERVKAQFKALQKFAKGCGRSLKQKHLPPPMVAIKPGREITAYHDPVRDRVWKGTFPGEAGFGQFGYYTPAGYLRRLRLSNIVFGDSVEFEGILTTKAGLSIVTSQKYIQAHPTRFIPTAEEITGYLNGLGFTHNDSLILKTEMAEGESAAVIGPTRLPASRVASLYRCNRCEPESLVEPSTTPSSSLSIPVSRLMLWERDDGVQLADTHDRNFIRAPDEAIIAIDVQPRLLPGHDFDAVKHGRPR